MLGSDQENARVGFWWAFGERFQLEEMIVVKPNTNQTRAHWDDETNEQS